MGGHLLIAKDFEGPDMTDDEVRESFTAKVVKTGRALTQIPSALGNVFRPRRRTSDRAENDLEKSSAAIRPTLHQEFSTRPAPPTSLCLADEDKCLPSQEGTPAPTVIGDWTSPPQSTVVECRGGSGVKLTKQVTFQSDELDQWSPPRGCAPPPAGSSNSSSDIIVSLPYAATVASVRTAVGDDEGERAAVEEEEIEEEEKENGMKSIDASSAMESNRRTGSQLSMGRRILRKVLACVLTLNTPPTITIFLSFPVALIPQLKRLFVTMPGSPLGPDGLAPLAFVLDTANFIGAASVPLGLFCLGSALARLSVPKPWTRLPLGAISAFTVVKLFLMPVLGVLLCTLFTSVIPIIDANDKVLRFVCLYVLSFLRMNFFT